METWPLCFDSGSLADFLYWATENHAAPSTIIICRERAEFLQTLQLSIQEAEQRANEAAQEPQTTRTAGIVAPEDNKQLPTRDAAAQTTNASLHPLRSRTLRILAASSTLKLCFCPSVPVLHAYLSTLPSEAEEADGDTGNRILGLVDVVRLHRQSGNLSAQNLGKGLAACVEAAARCGARLIVFESGGQAVEISDLATGSRVVGEETNDTRQETRDEAQDVQMASEDDSDAAAGRVDISDALEQQQGITIQENIPQSDGFLDEKIPVVSAATKVYGLSGDRAFMTRRVSIRAVVERWCRVETLPSWSR